MISKASSHQQWTGSIESVFPLLSESSEHREFLLRSRPSLIVLKFGPALDSPEGLLKYRVLGLMPRGFLIQYIWVGAREFMSSKFPGNSEAAVRHHQLGTAVPAILPDEQR